MKNIYYHLHTDFYEMDEKGVVTFPDDYNEQDIDEAINDLAMDNALSYGLDDEDLDNVYGTWRMATVDDLEEYGSMPL